MNLLQLVEAGTSAGPLPAMAVSSGAVSAAVTTPGAGHEVGSDAGVRQLLHALLRQAVPQSLQQQHVVVLLPLKLVEVQHAGMSQQQHEQRTEQQQ